MGYQNMKHPLSIPLLTLVCDFVIFIRWGRGDEFFFGGERAMMKILN